MKASALLFFHLFLVAIWSVSTPVFASAPLHVVVDPGHGGVDNGARNSFVREADIVLQVGRHLSKLLRRDPRFKVTTTRTEDVDLPLIERPEIAKKSQADLFVSIHVNSSYSPRLRGFEIYFQNQLLPNEEALFLAYKENMSQQLYNSSEHAIEAKKKGDVAQILDDLKKSHDMNLSRKLASIIQTHWLKKYPTKHHVIRQAPFRVLSTVPMPSILVELGYISHKRESKWMAKSSTQKKMAYILYNGLIDYKETLDKKHLQRHIVSHAQK